MLFEYEVYILSIPIHIFTLWVNFTWMCVCFGVCVLVCVHACVGVADCGVAECGCLRGGGVWVCIRCDH